MATKLSAANTILCSGIYVYLMYEGISALGHGLARHDWTCVIYQACTAKYFFFFTDTYFTLIAMALFLYVSLLKYGMYALPMFAFTLGLIGSVYAYGYSLGADTAGLSLVAIGYILSHPKITVTPLLGLAGLFWFLSITVPVHDGELYVHAFEITMYVQVIRNWKPGGWKV